MINSSDIEFVVFGVNGNEENKKHGFTEITNDNLFTINGHPETDGIYDLRLGTIDYNFLCSTCMYNKKLCTGHRGYLTLKAAVLQPIAISEIRQWLRSICLNCGELMIDKVKLKKIPLNKRMHEASIGYEGKVCNKCNSIHPKIKKDKEDRFTFWITYSDATDDYIDENVKNKKLYPNTILSIFEKISDETVELLNKTVNNHPTKLVVNVIEIPPNTIRPSIKNVNNDTNSYHDSTNILQHLIKRNNYIPDELPEYIYDINSKYDLMIENKDLDKSLQNLQQLYYDLIYGSDSTNALQGNFGKRGLIIGGRPIHSFLRNLPRKEGRIRSNLLGKRAFFTSRSTISGNINFRIDEVGIPIEFAKILQVEEYVQDYNIEWLTTIFLNGHSQYPGCSHIIKKSTGEIHDISKINEMYLEIGDILYRDVMNGDLAYFNRMPTLERSSICVHKVIIIKDPGIHTFQMNVLACELYNADFDGDQMHIWISREVSQRAEAMIMSSMSNWFISTKTSGTVNGQVQDSIIGSFELTKSSILIDKYHTMQLFASLNILIDFSLYGDDYKFTGYEIISLLLSINPINFKNTYKPKIDLDMDNIVVDIKNGKMLSGVLDSSIIGTNSKKGLFYLLAKEYDSKIAIESIFSLQQISLQFLLWKGFTVGTGDIILDYDSIKKVNKLISEILFESDLVSQQLLTNKIIPPIDSTVNKFYEEKQKVALQLNTSELMKIILNSIKPEYNNFFKMILSGSKGKTPNLISIMGAIGPSIINGQRMQDTFSFKRSLPYCTRFALDPKSYGFVSNNYMSGMTSTEFIFQDMASRFALINKALTTATTGYFMRKGIMNNQSSIVDNYRRVTKGTKIVQFIYGEDGYDSRELEDVSYNIVYMSDKELYDYISPINDNNLSLEIEKWYINLKNDRDLYRKINLSIESVNFKSNFNNIVTVSVNVKRIINNIIDKFKEKDNKLTIDKLNKVIYLYENISYSLFNDIQETKKMKIPLHKKNATLLISMLIRFELNPKVLEGLLIEQIDIIVKIIRYKYSNSLIDYGTAVGILAAQSISEPLTQYMLDSHHRSVGAGTTKSGINRINEIYSISNINREQTPSMCIPLHESFYQNDTNLENEIQKIANEIEFIVFKQIIINNLILLESVDNLIYPLYKNDKKWMDMYKISHPLVQIPNNLTNWCFRFEINKSILVLKSIDLETVIQKLKINNLNTFIIYNSETSEEIIIRIWFKILQKKKTSIEDLFNEKMNNILLTPIRGIEKILKTTIEKRDKYIIGNDNSFIKEKRYYINTFGTNLYNILMLNNIFDATSISSNSIPETFEMYGIEAARTKIVNETKIIIEDSKVNIRHLYIYADERTRTGRVTSIERNGLSAREYNNVLLRASYQDPIKYLIDAALSNTKSNIYGIAAPQLLGGIPKIGTLYNSLIIDEDFIKKNIKSLDEIINNL